MGSPLSGVLACIFFELLELVFSRVFYLRKTYFRYIDDALLIYPLKTTLPDLVDKFHLQNRKNNNLPFLNIMICDRVSIADELLKMISPVYVLTVTAK